MASASVSSGAAVSALLQKASQQYLECRRKVSAKFDEVKTLEKEIASLFETISTLGENATTRTAKSVGRLELNIVAIEGDTPVDDAVISVDIDPEYEEPEEAEPAKEEEKPEQSEGDKDEEAKEEAAEQEKTESENAEEAPVEEATEKAAPRRSIAWVDVDSLPLSVVYDPVQSREAVVTIAISSSAEDGEETEPVKEFRIPVSSLFQTGHINRWYVIKKVEHVHVDKTALTEVADEDEPTPAADEPAKEEDAEKPAEDAEKPAEEAEKPAEEADAEKPAEDEATTTEEAEKPAEESEKPVEGESEKEASADDSEKKAASDEPAVEIPTAPHQTLVAAEATTESEDTVVVLKEGKIHVQVHFTMSEIEKLSQTAIALAQQKQEAEAALEVLEREALSLRTKYERLNASQRSLSAGGVVKPRSTLLGGRGLGAVPARVEKSAYQKLKDSVSAVLTPQRTQVLTSFAIFFGSAALFHYQGDNLLA